MLELKQYQQRALEALAAYFRACQKHQNPSLAFYDVTAQYNDGQGIPYHPVDELPEPPYVCLRLPTGGGKTLLAAHTVGVTADEYLHTTSPVVLWLVPSTPIREQTLRALKDPQHPYRQALAAHFSTVTVLDLSEALAVQPGTLASGATVIVSTIQAPRVEDTEGRKIYEASGVLMSHFDGQPAGSLEVYENGQPIPSLANVLRLHRPLVIVDEAQNVRGELSFTTLARFCPACLLEFTATPHRGVHPSNVLYSVSAAELKTENMIKLPIRLEQHTDWRVLLSRAVAWRNQLETLAQEERAETREYIRPIMLLQAQPRRAGQETIDVETVRQALLNDQRIPKEQIAVSIGEQDDLANVTNLLDPVNPVRYIITVQKLREGWDCPFAYILFSVAEQHAQTAVEQILGRVLRLPKASRKQRPELNRAYAYAAAQSFGAAAKNLADALVENGFERQEVKDLIAPAPEAIQTGLDLNDLPLFAADQTVAIPVLEAPDFSGLPPELAQKVIYHPASSQLVVRESLTPFETEAVQACFQSPAAKNQIAAHLSGQPRRPQFSVPLLSIQQGDFLEAFEESSFLDHPWKLVGCDPYLSPELYPRRVQDGQVVEIDVNAQGRVQTNFLRELQLQLAGLSADQGWNVETLALWLDRKISHIDLPSEQSLPFIRSVIEKLLQEPGIQLAELVRDKFRLKHGVEELLKKYRLAAHKAAYDQFLLPEASTPLVVSPAICFTYDPAPMNYPCSPENSLFPNQHRFHKHYYPTVGNLRPAGEEFQCAQFIDALPQVEVWVRNLERRPQHAFWLQTSTDRFYPDFVCHLHDGRYLVVESKGGHLYGNPDSDEKRTIGALWEERSQGSCLFVMSEGTRWNMITAKLGA